jgi:hypothetical protein
MRWNPFTGLFEMGSRKKTTIINNNSVLGGGTGGASLAIGSVITGANVNRVLFTDGIAALAEADNFQFNGSTMTIGDAIDLVTLNLTGLLHVFGDGEVDGTLTAADMSANTGTFPNSLTTNLLKIGTLSPGRVPFSTTDGEIIDDGGFVYSPSDGILVLEKYLRVGTSTFTGGILFDDDIYRTLFKTATLSDDRTIQLPNKNGTVALTSDLPTASDYIQNQTASQQTAGMWIGGDARIDGKIGLGGSTGSSMLEISPGSVLYGIRINSTDTSDNSYPIDFNRASTSVQNAFNWSTAGTANWFYGQDNNGTNDLIWYDWQKGTTSLKLFHNSAAPGSVGIFEYGGFNSGTFLTYFNGTTGLLTHGFGAVFNETGAAVDFRVESDSDANMFFIDGTNNRAAIGSASPTAFFDIKASTTAAASLRIRSGSAPTSPNEGDMWNDSTQKATQTFSDGIKQVLVGTIFTQTADASVSNTTTETSIVGSGTGTLTLPANFWVVGKTIRVTMSGVYSTVAVTGDTVTIKTKYGSTVLASKATSGLVTGASNLAWWANLIVTCRSTGATGTVQVSGGVEYQIAGSAVIFDELNNGVATSTLDTTASGLFDITVTHSAANAANTVKSLVSSWEVLN